MKKSLLLAAAALSALALASPAYAQREFRGNADVTEDREEPRGRDDGHERRRVDEEARGQRHNQELLGGAQREWSPGGRGVERSRPENTEEDGPRARGWAPPQTPQAERRDDADQRGRGEWNRGQEDQRGRGEWNRGEEDQRGRGEWNRGQEDQHGRGEWNRGQEDQRGRGEWNRGQEDQRGRGEWNRGQEDQRGRGEWNRGADDGRWRDRDNDHDRGDRGNWNGRDRDDNRHRDWRRDDHGRDWREWRWDRDDHRYARWRHTHRDFDRPRYRDWRHVRHGYYFDWGYAQIVSAFWGYRYHWWSYDGWRRPHRPWYVGGYLPDWVYWEPVPWDLYWRLPPPPYGCRYIVVDRDILLISLSTGIILDALLYY
ncbi:MAG: hypothetical protein K2P58_08785 [Hyphomonadaceae bacterium]|nr:hypothetical protein [Hyphomonadaceae bacterium]